MNDLIGSAVLTRFHLGRDRLRLGVWIVAVVLGVAITAASTKGLYPTQADLDEAAAASVDNPAALAFSGPAQGLDTVGGQVAFQIGAFGLSVVGLMSLLVVGRLTRAEEESGRLELVRSMAVGRHAPIAAALLVGVLLNIAVGALVSACLVALGLPLVGSVTMGGCFVAVGLVFVAVQAVTAQLTENPRVASGLTGAVLGASFLIRAAGDVGNGTASWFSPIGWAQRARPYAGEQLRPLGLALFASLALVALAVALAARRDVGAGLLPARPGRARAAATLGSPLGLAVRLQRASVAWWSLAVLATGVAYGSVADSIGDFIGDNEALADVIARAGAADLTDSYLATSLLILALLTAGFAVQSTLRTRTEESAQRIDTVVAAGVSRQRWLAAQLAVSLGGSAIVLAAGGLGLGVTYASMAGEPGQVPQMVLDALAYLPAVWLFVGITVTLFALVPRWAAAAWAALAVCAVIGLFGSVIDLPSSLMGISPFERTPRVPADGLDAAPLVVLALIALAGTWGGLTAFRRRDIG